MTHPSLETLITEWHGPVYATALRLLGDPGEAQDATQAAMIRLWRDLPKYDPARPLRPWVYTVTLNAIRSHRLRLRTRRHHEERAAMAMQSASTPNPSEQAELATLVQRAIADLPDELQDPLVLCYYQEITQVEAADVLSLSRSTLQDRLHSGLERLRQALQGSGYAMTTPTIETLLQNSPRIPVPPELAGLLLQACQATTVAPAMVTWTAGWLAKGSAVALALIILAFSGLRCGNLQRPESSDIARHSEPTVTGTLAASTPESDPSPSLSPAATKPGAVNPTEAAATTEESPTRMWRGQVVDDDTGRPITRFRVGIPGYDGNAEDPAVDNDEIPYCPLWNLARVQQEVLDNSWHRDFDTPDGVFEIPLELAATRSIFILADDYQILLSTFSAFAASVDAGNILPDDPAFPLDRLPEEFRLHKMPTLEIHIIDAVTQLPLEKVLCTDLSPHYSRGFYCGDVAYDTYPFRLEEGVSTCTGDDGILRLPVHCREWRPQAVKEWTNGWVFRLEKPGYATRLLDWNQGMPEESGIYDCIAEMQPAIGALDVQALDSRGNPAPAFLRIERRFDNNLFNFVTDEQGHCCIENMPDGRYQIRACRIDAEAAAGFAPGIILPPDHGFTDMRLTAGAAITIENGRRVPVTLTLDPNEPWQPHWPGDPCLYGTVPHDNNITHLYLCYEGIGEGIGARNGVNIRIHAGDYTCHLPGAGEYKISAYYVLEGMATGFSRALGHVSLGDNERRQLDIPTPALDECARVGGRILIESGGGMQPSSLWMDLEAEDAAPYRCHKDLALNTLDNPENRFLWRIPKGRYRIQANYQKGPIYSSLTLQTFDMAGDQMNELWTLPTATWIEMEPHDAAAREALDTNTLDYSYCIVTAGTDMRARENRLESILLPGNYDLLFKAEGYEPHRMTFHVIGSEEVQSVVVPLTPGLAGVLAGRVLHAETGKPVTASLCVHCRHDELGLDTEWREIRDGAFSFSGLPAGPYTIEVWQNTSPQVKIGAFPFTINDREQRRDLELPVTLK